MYHSIFFGDEGKWKNTYDDWYLIPTSRPVFNPPEAKTNYFDISGADWHLDMTETLNNQIAYNARIGQHEFIVENGHKEWYILYSEIMNYLHGRRMKAVLENDLGFYYVGRFKVNNWKSDKRYSKITLDYDVHPYKFERFSSLEDWEWDSFNFETGIIREYKDLYFKRELVVIIPGRRKAVIPTFTVQTSKGDGMLVEFEGVTHHIPEGVSQVANIVIKEGLNALRFTTKLGNGTVSIDYRGGSL